MNKDSILAGEGYGDANDYDFIEVTNPGIDVSDGTGSYEALINEYFDSIDELNEAIAVLKGNKGDIKHLNPDQQNFLKMVLKTYEVSGSLSEVASVLEEIKRAIFRIFNEMETADCQE